MFRNASQATRSTTRGPTPYVSLAQAAIATLVLALVGGVIDIGVSASAQPPIGSAQQAEQIEQVERIEQAERIEQVEPESVVDPAEEKIRRALAGEGDGDDGTMLGGLLDAISERGSVIEGSSLDQASSSNQFGGPEEFSADERQSRQASERRYLVAEQLLRTARMLAALQADISAGHHDLSTQSNERENLVNEMRSAAVKLLSPAN